LAALTALIDTSVLIGEGSDGLADADGEDGWAVSVVAIGELGAGVLRANEPEIRAARLRRLTAVLGTAPVLDVDQMTAARYGELRAATGRLPTNDLWSAATALAYDLTLVTRDERQAALPLVRTRLVASI